MTTETDSPGTHEMKDVGVKALEWRNDPNYIWVAHIIFGGHYLITEVGGKSDLAFSLEVRGWFGFDMMRGFFETLAEAKSAAQADFNTRIRSALSIPAPQATNCAVCGVHKATPLRRDEMGGYVCLTCVEDHLNALSIPVAAHDVAVGEMSEYVRQAYDILSSGEPPYSARECRASHALSRALASPPSVPTTIDDSAERRFLKDETSEWETSRQAGTVTVHSRMMDGVLCRWWGDGEPPAGVAAIDEAALGRKP